MVFISLISSVNITLLQIGVYCGIYSKYVRGATNYWNSASIQPVLYDTTGLVTMDLRSTWPLKECFFEI